MRTDSPLAPVLALLEVIPDLVELAGEKRGYPMTMPDPGTEHGRRLYDTLRVAYVAEGELHYRGHSMPWPVLLEQP